MINLFLIYKIKDFHRFELTISHRFELPLLYLSCLVRFINPNPIFDISSKFTILNDLVLIF